MSGIIPIGTYIPVINPDRVYTNVDIPLYALLVLAILVIKNKNAVVEKAFNTIRPSTFSAMVRDISVPPVSTTIISDTITVITLKITLKLIADITYPDTRIKREMGAA
jgi:hypothetical protein